MPGFRYVALSDPNTKRKFYRVGWVVFEAGTDMDAALGKLHLTKVCDASQTPKCVLIHMDGDPDRCIPVPHDLAERRCHVPHAHHTRVCQHAGTTGTGP